jgi:hypothetical protein
MQCLARDVAEVTWAQASAIMAEARATREEKLAQERAVPLAATLGEMNEVAWRASALEGELVAARRARDMAEEKLPSLATKAATIDQQRVAVEEQCEHLVHELTLLNLRGSELCMTITGAPPQTPIYKGMRFVAAHDTKVVM